MKILHKQNFTLIEMLIVIVIIAILFALLFPAINSVKERAKKVECVARVKGATDMTLFAAQLNGNRLPFSGVNYNPVTGDTSNMNFQAKVMSTVHPDLLYKKAEEWRTFVCTNVLPGWNHSASASPSGIPYNADHPEPFARAGWASVNPAGPIGSPWYCGYTRVGSEEQGPLYALGNFGTNQNGPLFDYKATTSRASMGWEKTGHLARIPSPDKRAYIVEVSEHAAYVSSQVVYPLFDKPISRGSGSDNSGTGGFVPGLGAGRLGKEKMERIGYAGDMNDLSQEQFDRVNEDVTEGRHGGTTLHGFFDGHVEAIPVEVVGQLQLGPGEDKDDLVGPYGNFSKAVIRDSKKNKDNENEELIKKYEGVDPDSL